MRQTYRKRLHEAVLQAEKAALQRPDDPRPVQSAVAFLSGYIQREAPEAADVLMRILTLDYKV